MNNIAFQTNLQNIATKSEFLINDLSRKHEHGKLDRAGDTIGYLVAGAIGNQTALVHASKANFLFQAKVLDSYVESLQDQLQCALWVAKANPSCSQYVEHLQEACVYAEAVSSAYHFDPAAFERATQALASIKVAPCENDENG